MNTKLKIFLSAAVTGIGMLLSFAQELQEAKNEDPLLPYIKIDKVWMPEDFDEFLNHLNKEQLKQLKAVLKMDPQKDYGATELKEIKKKVINGYYSAFTYYFREDVDYDKLVQWVAGKAGVADKDIIGDSTFKLEQLIYAKISKEYTATVTPEEQKKLLEDSKYEKYLYYSGIRPIPLPGITGVLSSAYIIAGAVIIAQEKHRNILATVLQIHMFKVQALKDSGQKIPIYTEELIIK